MVKRIAKKLSKVIPYVIAITAFLFVVGNYYSRSGDLGKNITLFAHSVFDAKEPEEVLPVPEIFSGRLVYNGSDWVLEWNEENETYEEDGALVQDLFALTSGSDDELTVKKNGPDNGYFTVDIAGLDQVHSSKGFSKLPIPHNVEEARRSIFEQTSGDIQVGVQEDFLPILGYHNVIPDDEPIITANLDVHVSDFEEQVKFATEVLGCRWYTFGDIMENYVLKGIKTPRGACVLTLDDGRKNNFTIALPILDKYSVKASFYVIAERLGQKTYMSLRDVRTLFEDGHEIGAHSLNGGGLVNVDRWYDGNKTYEEVLYEQITELKQYLGKLGYPANTYAYPLGEWNKQVEQTVIDSGYIAARDTQKPNTWRDRRPLTVTFDDKQIWHMYYFKGENRTLGEFNALAYNGWWQFEESYRVPDGAEDTIEIRSTIVPTDDSYGVVTLPNPGDSMEVPFLLSESGDYTIEIFVQTGSIQEGAFARINDFTFNVNGTNVPHRAGEEDACVTKDWRIYCAVLIDRQLDASQHLLGVRANKKNVAIDKFRIFQHYDLLTEYDINVLYYPRVGSN